tara:strand:+ start:179 stop:769 length:591 start_codon:yes stop_codon:yes gene_type:complete
MNTLQGGNINFSIKNNPVFELLNIEEEDIKKVDIFRREMNGYNLDEFDIQKFKKKVCGEIIKPGCLVTGYVTHNKYYQGGTSSKLQGIVIKNNDSEKMYHGVGFLYPAPSRLYWLTWHERFTGGVKATNDENTRKIFLDRLRIVVKNGVQTQSHGKLTWSQILRDMIQKDGMPSKYSSIIKQLITSDSLSTIDLSN